MFSRHSLSSALIAGIALAFAVPAFAVDTAGVPAYDRYVNTTLTQGDVDMARMLEKRNFAVSVKLRTAETVAVQSYVESSNPVLVVHRRAGVVRVFTLYTAPPNWRDNLAAHGIAT